MPNEMRLPSARTDKTRVSTVSPTRKSVEGSSIRSCAMFDTWIMPKRPRVSCTNAPYGSMRVMRPLTRSPGTMWMRVPRCSFSRCSTVLRLTITRWWRVSISMTSTVSVLPMSGLTSCPRGMPHWERGIQACSAPTLSWKFSSCSRRTRAETRLPTSISSQLAMLRRSASARHHRLSSRPRSVNENVSPSSGASSNSRTLITP